MTTIPLVEAPAHLSWLVDDAVRTHQRVEITRNGTRAAVLVGADDFDELMETLDVLADTDAVRLIHDALVQAAAGEVYVLGDVAQEMRAAGRLPMP